MSTMHVDTQAPPLSSFAVFRMPRQGMCTLVGQTSGQPAILPSIDHIGLSEGFVVAPFAMTPRCPLLLIRAEQMTRIAVESLPDLVPDSQMPLLATHPLQPSSPCSDRASYAAAFARCHEALADGRFRKIVLARQAFCHARRSVSPIALFIRACQMYPRLFVALTYTPQSGMWLTATPELLLQGQRRQWRTMALAGTMSLDGADLSFDTGQPFDTQRLRWSTKNIEEQRIVASYVADRLKPFSANVVEEGPRTVRAANLVHLCTEFRFGLDTPRDIGRLLSLLHPTPAVCGLPKADAAAFIASVEPSPRLYYSGFAGPLQLDADGSGLASTHLYVSLRCMQLFANGYVLHAGGGLLRDSDEEQEWQETEAKMNTMRQLIDDNEKTRQQCTATRKT